MESVSSNVSRAKRRQSRRSSAFSRVSRPASSSGPTPVHTPASGQVQMQPRKKKQETPPSRPQQHWKTVSDYTHGKVDESATNRTAAAKLLQVSKNFLLEASNARERRRIQQHRNKAAEIIQRAWRLCSYQKQAARTRALQVISILSPAIRRHVAPRVEALKVMKRTVNSIFAERTVSRQRYLVRARGLQACVVALLPGAHARRLVNVLWISREERRGVVQRDVVRRSEIGRCERQGRLALQQGFAKGGAVLAVVRRRNMPSTPEPTFPPIDTTLQMLACELLVLYREERICRLSTVRTRSTELTASHDTFSQCLSLLRLEHYDVRSGMLRGKGGFPRYHVHSTLQLSETLSTVPSIFAEVVVLLQKEGERRCVLLSAELAALERTLLMAGYVQREDVRLKSNPVKFSEMSTTISKIASPPPKTPVSAHRNLSSFCQTHPGYSTLFTGGTPVPIRPTPPESQSHFDKVPRPRAPPSSRGLLQHSPLPVLAQRADMMEAGVMGYFVKHFRRGAGRCGPLVKNPRATKARRTTRAPCPLQEWEKLVPVKGELLYPAKVRRSYETRFGINREAAEGNDDTEGEEEAEEDTRGRGVPGGVAGIVSPRQWMPQAPASSEKLGHRVGVVSPKTLQHIEGDTGFSMQRFRFLSIFAKKEE